jgi:thiol:disulfide interchange protein DsbC
MLYLQRYISVNKKEHGMAEYALYQEKKAIITRKIKHVILPALFVSAVILVMSPGNVTAFSDAGCEGDCSKCHSLTRAEAAEIIKQLKTADAKVLDVKISPIKSLWEISIQSQGKEAPVYLDFSKKYIVQGPIIELSTGADKTKEQSHKKKIYKGVDVSKISLKSALVLGRKSANKKVIVFTDPDCPYCGGLHEEMKKVVKQRKDIVFYIRLFPLKMHPDAYWKSKSIICNNSMQMLDDNFSKKPIPRTECKTAVVDNTIKAAERLKITGTPTLIFGNGVIQAGAMSADDLIKLVDANAE